MLFFVKKKKRRTKLGKGEYQTNVSGLGLTYLS